jgi:hypothetical protein
LPSERVAFEIGAHPLLGALGIVGPKASGGSVTGEVLIPATAKSRPLGRVDLPVLGWRRREL